MAENDAMPTLPKKCGPYISSVTSRGMNLVIRGIVLFFIGVFLALVLNLLQIQRNVTLFPPDVITSIFSSAWWVPPCCGTASGKLSCVRVPGWRGGERVETWLYSYKKLYERCGRWKFLFQHHCPFWALSILLLSLCVEIVVCRNCCSANLFCC